MFKFVDLNLNMLVMGKLQKSINIFHAKKMKLPVPR